MSVYMNVQSTCTYVCLYVHMGVYMGLRPGLTAFERISFKNLDISHFNFNRPNILVKM